jgi:hypothetical protein
MVETATGAIGDPPNDPNSEVPPGHERLTRDEFFERFPSYRVEYDRLRRRLDEQGSS